MTVPEVPPRTSTPSLPLGTAPVPAALVPMKLPLMEVPEVPLSVTRMPLVRKGAGDHVVLGVGGGGRPGADGVVDGAQADVDAIEPRCPRISCRCSRCRCSCPRRGSGSRLRPTRTPSLAQVARDDVSGGGGGPAHGVVRRRVDDVQAVVGVGDVAAVPPELVPMKLFATMCCFVRARVLRSGQRPRSCSPRITLLELACRVADEIVLEGLAVDQHAG